MVYTHDSKSCRALNPVRVRVSPWPQMEREIIEKILSKYDATFKLTEVEALLEGKPLPHSANPTLLDIEQMVTSHQELVPHIGQSGSSGNDNTE